MAVFDWFDWLASVATTTSDDGRSKHSVSPQIICPNIHTHTKITKNKTRPNRHQTALHTHLPPNNPNTACFQYIDGVCYVLMYWVFEPFFCTIFTQISRKRHTSSYYSSKHRYSSYMCFPSVSCLFGDDSNTDCSHGGLASQDDIRQQPHGLSTVLQEMGLIVSTGETGHVVFEYRFLRQRRSHRR